MAKKEKTNEIVPEFIEEIVPEFIEEIVPEKEIREFEKVTTKGIKGGHR